YFGKVRLRFKCDRGPVLTREPRNQAHSRPRSISGMKSARIRQVLSTCCIALLAGVAQGAEPISIDALARVPAIQSPSMSADGENLVAIIATPGSDYADTALATWDLADLSKDPVITPSGDRMKFIAASALKADRLLVFGRQEWTGQLGGCGEGSVSGATKTFGVNTYLR